MTPLRRGKGGRRTPQEAPEEVPDKGPETGAEAVAEDAVDEAGGDEEQADQRARARELARAERRAQKEAVRADKEAKKRAARERKAERKRERRDRKAEEKRKAAKQKAEKQEAEKKNAAAPKPKAKDKPRPTAASRTREKAKPNARAKAKAREKAKPAPRGRERERAGVALKRTGAKVNAALTGPRARKAATRVDNGIQSAWKLLLAGLATLLAGALVIGRFVVGGLRELGAFWIRTAEILGNAILWVERRLRPVVLAGLRALRRALAFAERVVTPRRAVAFVVIAAAAALAASQFVDYRGVRIGAPAYADVEAVAPAPQTDRQTTGSVHGYAMVPVAVVIIVAALLALRGRWRMARVIPVLALLAIAVSLLLDARKGLDEGDAAIAYQGAQAVLIEGFWLQLASATVLVVTGILLARYARTSGAQARRRRPFGDGRERPRRRKRRFGIAGVRA
jgi:hypothetical protein